MLRKASLSRKASVPTVYSYIRFSTPEQRLGDSERRQVEDAQAWAKRKGYPLDNTLRPDLGISSFRGAHRTKGNLGAFLQRVEAGDIPEGSILLVENLDRLSREGVAATLRHIIFKLWEHKITLQTLSPEEGYEPNCDSHPKFLALFLYLQRAQDESLQKSRRIRASRDQSRKQARTDRRVMTSMCPAWLVAKADKSGFEVIKPAGKTIAMIFDLYRKGNSVRAIEKKLNASAPWVPATKTKNPVRRGTGWRTGYIKKILHNRAVIGEYQPHIGRAGARRPEGEPIADYYPAVVKPEVFHAVATKLALNKNIGGKTGKVLNVLTHIVKCAYCGGPMRFEDKGKPPKGAQYLVCDNAARGLKCKTHRIRYDECVDVLLDNCQRIRPDEVLPTPKEHTQKCIALRERVSGLAAELESIETKLANLTNNVADATNKDIANRLYALMDELEQSKATKIADRLETETELKTAEHALKTFSKWQSSLLELKKHIKSEQPEIRMALRSHLRELIAKIEVFAIGYTSLKNEDEESVKPRKGGPLHMTDDIIEYIYNVAPDEIRRSKQLSKLANEVAKRRMSKEGRFIRVHFKSGQRIDLSPPNSLATGWRLIDSKMTFVRPDIGKMWR